MLALQDITLRNIRSSEFNRLHNIWYKNQKIEKSMDTAFLVLPLKSNSYVELIESFLESEHCDRICVNKYGKWQKYYTRKMEKSNVKEIAEIAKNDRFKKGHLELNFKLEPQTLDYIKLKFVEFEEGIFAYEVMFPNKYHFVFKWETEPRFKRSTTCGLWVPSGKRIVIGNLTLN